MPPNYKKIQAGAAATGLYEAADTTAKSSQYDISHQDAMTAQNVENIGSITSTISDTIGVASQLYGKGEFAAEFELGKKAIGKKYGDVTEVTESGESFSDLNWFQKLFSEKHYKAGDAILSKGAVTGIGKGAQYGMTPDLSMYDELDKSGDDTGDDKKSDEERWPRNEDTYDGNSYEDDRGAHGGNIEDWAEEVHGDLTNQEIAEKLLKKPEEEFFGESVGESYYGSDDLPPEDEGGLLKGFETAW